MIPEQQTKALTKEVEKLRRQVAELETLQLERRQEEELLRIFRMNSPIGVFMIQDGKFVFVNNEFRQITGANEGQLIGVNTLSLVHPEDRVAVREEAIKMLKGMRYLPYQYRLLSEGGVARVMSEVVVSVNYQGKRAVLGHSSDVTEREQARLRLQELYKKEKEFRQQLQMEAQERIEFARALVHELKTPLTPVMASSELLASELQEEPWASLARNIYRGASNLNRRVDELLDLAQVQVGILQFKPTAIEPQVLLREIADEMKAMVLSNRQSLELILDTTLPMVWADEERLRQVLFNLIINASKFSPENSMIAIKAKVRKSFLVVEVQDSGPGIPKSEQKDIFRPYHRQPGGREQVNGLGLGLALCKNLIELHHGEIWVKSEVGKGSTFGFSIPLVNPKQLEHERRK